MVVGAGIDGAGPGTSESRWLGIQKVGSYKGGRCSALTLKTVQASVGPSHSSEKFFLPSNQEAPVLSSQTCGQQQTFKRAF